MEVSLASPQFACHRLVRELTLKILNKPSLLILSHLYSITNKPRLQRLSNKQNTMLSHMFPNAMCIAFH